MQVKDHELLARMAKVQGWSHRQIAEACGWEAHSYVGRLMRGEVHTLAPDAAIKIAHLFGVPVDTLFLTRSSKNPRRSVQDAA